MPRGERRDQWDRSILNALHESKAAKYSELEGVNSEIQQLTAQINQKYELLEYIPRHAKEGLYNEIQGLKYQRNEYYDAREQIKADIATIKGSIADEKRASQGW